MYLTGFSAGGQLVTKYMFIRQVLEYSIPIQMAVSVNPFFYTFATDTFDTNDLPFPCGLSSTPFLFTSDCDTSIFYDPITWGFICNQHIQQYYNENYGVLIGTLDTATIASWNCQLVQGANRYERAQNFYAFSDTNAIARGTTLLWQYDTVPNVGHDANLMYNTKANPTDSFTIVENMLFNTPWHPVPTFVPVANFNVADTGLTVTFTDATLNTPNYWYWDFGDGDTSLAQNPVHTYSSSGTYYICLTVGDSCVTDSYCDSVTILAVGIDDNFSSESEVTIYPNPNNGSFTISIENSKNTVIEIYTISGQLILQKSIIQNSTKINLTKHLKGMYFVKIENDNKVVVKKIVYQ